METRTRHFALFSKGQHARAAMARWADVHATACLGLCVGDVSVNVQSSQASQPAAIHANNLQSVSDVQLEKLRTVYGLLRFSCVGREKITSKECTFVNNMNTLSPSQSVL